MEEPHPPDKSGKQIDAVWVQTVLLEYLQEDSSLKEIQFAKEETQLHADDISDGHLNYILRVYPHSDPSQSVILKYATPYIKILGPDFPMSPDQGHLEYRALVKYHTINPGCVPVPIAYSLKHSALCMEDLQGYTVYRTWLLGGNVDEGVARKLAQKIAFNHYHTHLATIGQEALQQLDKEYHNSDIINMSTNTFNNPLTPNRPTNHWSPLLDDQVQEMQQDPELLRIMKHMQSIFHKKKECLIHGDLHTGSAMVKDKDIKIFDVEFTMVGPCAVDLGRLMAHYICYYHHMHHPTDSHMHRDIAHKLIRVCHVTVEEYLKHMTCSIEEREPYVQQLMSETAGFAGCELVHRLLTAAHTEDMDSLEIAQPDALTAGCRLLRSQHHLYDADAIMNKAMGITQ